MFSQYMNLFHQTLTYYSEIVSRDNYYKTYGFSVRCLHD